MTIYDHLKNNWWKYAVGAVVVAEGCCALRGHKDGKQGEAPQVGEGIHTLVSTESNVTYKMRFQTEWAPRGYVEYEFRNGAEQQFGTALESLFGAYKLSQPEKSRIMFEFLRDADRMGSYLKGFVPGLVPANPPIPSAPSVTPPAAVDEEQQVLSLFDILQGQSFKDVCEQLNVQTEDHIIDKMDVELMVRWSKYNTAALASRYGIANMNRLPENQFSQSNQHPYRAPAWTRPSPFRR